MIVFLTASPTGPLDNSRYVEGLDKMNEFTENLRRFWKENSRCLIISADPEAFERNDEMASYFLSAIRKDGFSVSDFDVWDDRTEDTSYEKLHSYDVILLGGGHVPTQNAFFRKISLREKIQGFEGIVIGISAGSMNSADIVYAQPELTGESENPEYVRFLEGLNLTRTMILPHYQMVKDSVLDGKKLFEDITYGDSMGKNFLVLPDGSYLLIDESNETVWGEAYKISDGRIWEICSENEHVLWMCK